MNIRHPLSPPLMQTLERVQKELILNFAFVFSLC